MVKKFLVIITVVSTFLVGGCASMKRCTTSYCASDLPTSSSQAGKISLGMSKKEVVRAIGEPETGDGDFSDGNITFGSRFLRNKLGQELEVWQYMFKGKGIAETVVKNAVAFVAVFVITLGRAADFPFTQNSEYCLYFHEGNLVNWGDCWTTLQQYGDDFKSPPKVSGNDKVAVDFLPDPQRATLYIYRKGYWGHSWSIAVSVNGRDLGASDEQTYFRVNILPGKYTVESNADNYSSLSLSVEAGKNYFVWQEEQSVIMGWSKPNVFLRQVDEATGRAGVRESKLLWTSISDTNLAPMKESDELTAAKAFELNPRRRKALDDLGGRTCTNSGTEASAQSFFRRGKILLGIEEYQSALNCFLRAQEMEKGTTVYRESCYAIGSMYELGLGVDKDMVAALSWFHKAEF